MSEHLIHTIEKMALLSRIAISDEEKQAFANSLSSVIQYFDVLNSFDTSQEKPLYSVLDNQTIPLREDESKDLLSREDFLKTPLHP